ncbi:hypothetical protein [Paenibacillus sp. Soil522]|nr:hypothetical protein [Paenibacillus sp. Soil522]
MFMIHQPYCRTEQLRQQSLILKVAEAKGSASIKVTYAGKSVTIRVTVK